MLETFADRAKDVVETARTEATRLEHEQVGTEHLLLGLLARADGPAATVLREQGATLEAARHKVAEVTTASGATSSGGELSFTPRAQRALERAARFARQEREPRVQSEHVLLGVLDVEGLGCQVLRGLGIDVAHVRDALGRARAGEAPAPVAPPDEPVSPRCASCGASLDESLAARTMHAQRETGVAKRVMVVFCAACGAAVGVVPP